LFREALRAYGLPAGVGEPTAVAARLRQRPAQVREALVAALDEWIALAQEPAFQLKEPHLPWLRELVEEADPGGWGHQVRLATAEKDRAQRRAALEQLAAKADVRRLPAQALTSLARRLQEVRANASAVRLLRRAQAEHPGDFWVNHDLGMGLWRLHPPEAAQAVRYLTAAVALRPHNPGVLLNLGVALKDQGHLQAAIAEYQQAIALDPKYATAHYNLGIALADKGDLGGAVAAFRRAIALAPKLARAHNNLGIALADKGDRDAAIAAFRRAIALDRKDAAAHANLGNALQRKGDVDGAIRAYRTAIACDPKDAHAHTGLGLALEAKGELRGAIAAYRQAIALDPKLAAAHTNLGVALEDKGELDGAIAAYRRAIALAPKDAQTHNRLGALLCDWKHDYDGAIAEFKKAIALDPKHTEAHYNLGNALGRKGDWDGAVAQYRQAIALKPDHAEAYCNLGGVLTAQGRLAEALACYRRGHELGTKQAAWRYPSAQWVRRAERLVALESKLPAFLEGSVKPKDNGARLGLARVCKLKKRYQAAARLYADAFTADPKVAEDLKAGYCYDAACNAALAGSGQGKDAAQPDAKERARWCQQALDWLRADLARWAKRLEVAQPAGRRVVAAAMRHWQQDPDLAGIRDADAVAQLPAEEQKACRQLWADVAALLKKAQPSK
jgi:tetratricopeptide (TPR) repeat protein